MRIRVCRVTSLGMALLLVLSVVLSGLVFSVPAEAATLSDSALITPTIYNPAKDSGYGLQNAVSKTALGIGQYSSLKISTSSGGTVQAGTVGGYNAYGINGSEVILSLKIPSKTDYGSYKLCVTDSYESVAGVKTGKVASGALVVQTSSDGKSWSGSVTVNTDLYNYYKSKGMLDKFLKVYTIKGSDVSKGVHVRVLYAYEVYLPKACTHENSWWDRLWGASKYKHADDNEYLNYVEAYTFYVFNNNPSAVTIQNLSASAKLSAALEGEDGATVNAYKNAETLRNNSYTVSGFQINNSANPTATIEVYKNGSKISIPGNKTFKDRGKYLVRIRTLLGVSRETTIYVDCSSNETVYETYFGSGGFLQGSKRIYQASSEIPVYEGGKTSYSLAAISENTVPLTGKIYNLTTGECIDIRSARSIQSGVIKTAGEYYVELHTDCAYYDNNASGDARSFEFRFYVIEEGTAPGPVVNRESLAKFAATTPSDFRPRYYGVTFSTAASGTVTIAFPTYEDALKYAFEYEKGVVELQPDASYRYRGSLAVKQKTIYRDNWNLTDAMYYFASEAVQELWFDLSDIFTYRTLDSTILDEVANIRTLELDKSVVILSLAHSAADFVAENALPFFSPKPYAGYVRTAEGKLAIDGGLHDFKFVSDRLGIDSYRVTVTDSEGKNYNIRYGEGVGVQLEAYGCSSGIITITEETKYGDSVKYQAVYLTYGENTASFDLGIVFEGKESALMVDRNCDLTNVIKANELRFTKAVDSLDPYSFVKVTKDGGEYDIYTLDELTRVQFKERGTYVFTCVNRLGYSFSFSVEIVPCFTVSFAGEGTQNCETLKVSYMQKDVVLPKLTRYGYIHTGFVEKGEADSAVYTDSIDQYQLVRDLVLEPVWVAKTISVRFEVDGVTVKEFTAAYGEKITLSPPALAEQLEFDFWMLNGAVCKEEDFEVKTEEDICFVASYHLKEYQLWLDGVTTTPLTVRYGDTVSLPLPSLNVGTEFVCWTDGNKTYTDSYTHLAMKDVTLIARTREKTYELSLVMNGKRLTETSLNYGDKIELPDPKTKDGERFVSWFCDGVSIGSVYIHLKDDDVVLEAKTERIEYALNFILEGSIVHTEKVYYGEVVALPEVTTPEGVIFEGWMLNGGLCSSKSYQHNSTESNVCFVAKLTKFEEKNTVDSVFEDEFQEDFTGDNVFGNMPHNKNDIDEAFRSQYREEIIVNNNSTLKEESDFDNADSAESYDEEINAEQEFATDAETAKQVENKSSGRGFYLEMSNAGYSGTQALTENRSSGDVNVLLVILVVILSVALVVTLIYSLAGNRNTRSNNYGGRRY